MTCFMQGWKPRVQGWKRHVGIKGSQQMPSWNEDVLSICSFWKKKGSFGVVPCGICHVVCFSHRCGFEGICGVVFQMLTFSCQFALVSSIFCSSIVALYLGQWNYYILTLSYKLLIRGSNRLPMSSVSCSCGATNHSLLSCAKRMQTNFELERLQ